MKDLVIIGGGGFGREVKALVDEINEVEPTWNFLGYIDDNTEKGTAEGDVILGNIDWFLAQENKPWAIISIANPPTREKVAARCEEAGVKFATLVHPTVRIKGNLCTIGEGSIICDGTVLAVNSHLGKHCIINMDCGIGHDTVLGDFVSIMSNSVIAGEVEIGKCCYFGLHNTVINQLKLAEYSTFGAGAVIVKNADVPGTYVGVPAKCIKTLQK